MVVQQCDIPSIAALLMGATPNNVMLLKHKGARGVGLRFSSLSLSIESDKHQSIRNSLQFIYI